MTSEYIGGIYNLLDEIKKLGGKMEDGIKHDNNKPRLGEMVCDFKLPMLELCKVWEFGANKYSKSNWKGLKDGTDRYTNAMIRHLVDEVDDLYDKESGYLHAAHIAFNALARLYFISKEQHEPIETDEAFVKIWNDLIRECNN